MVVTSLQIGGAETQVADLSERLKARGWDVAVVCLIEPSGHAARLAAAGIPVHSLGMKRGVPDPRAALRLARIIAAFKPDLVHSHMVHANLLSRLTRLIARTPPLICTAHSLRETSERGGATWHKELLYRLTDSLADHTTIICRAGWRRYVETRAAPASRLEVVPNGIDCRRFAPDAGARAALRSALGIGDDTFVWLAAARLVEAKDFPNMLRAFAQVAHKNWTLLIAGDGPLRSALEDLSIRLDLAAQVRFLGIRKDTPALYNAADGFVLSSELEGLPLSAIEASVSGLPCVVTDVGGNREVVIDGVTGYVTPTKDAAALASALARLMARPALERAELGRAARARSLENFDMDSVVRRWETIYRRFLPSSRSKVAYVITRAERGGAQIHVQDLLANRPDEHEVLLVAGEPGYLCDWAREQGIRTTVIPALKRQMSPGKDLRALWRLIRFIRTESPALIHAHTSKAGLLCRVAGLLTQTPVIFTAHTWSFAEGFSWLQRAIAVPLERFAALCGRRIIVVSEANAKAAVSHRIAEPFNLITIPSAVPDTPFRARPGLNRELKVAMVARFAPQKDYETLLRAAALVDVPDPWQLLLVGNGPTRREMEALANQLGLGARVRFAGDPGEIAPFLATCDLLVQSTNWEGLPLSILEAMRAGLPVISTDVGGCAEAVTHGVNGFLTAKGDAAGLALRIGNLLSSRKLLETMGAAGRARYEADFRVENMVLKTWQVYASEVPRLRFVDSLRRLKERLRQESGVEVGETLSSGR